MGSLDLKKREVEMDKTNAIGSNWKEIRKELFTQEEIKISEWVPVREATKIRFPWSIAYTNSQSGSI